MSVQLPTRRLVSQNDAALIQRPDVPRSRFTGSWTRKTAFNAGNLVPFMVDEVLPGDHLTYQITPYVRISTPLFPMLDNQRVDTFLFFVPMRLVWEAFQRFMGEQASPADTIDYTIPQLATTAGGDAVGSLVDHMGIPVLGQVAALTQLSVNALPFRAYNLIYNSWFRDENLTDSISVPTGNTGDTIGMYTVRKRAKSHDYFTSALPWPQKFDAPSVPLGGLAPIIGLGSFNESGSAAGPISIYETDKTAQATYNSYKKTWVDPASDSAEGGVYMKMTTAPDDIRPDVWADLSQATGVAINTLRQAWMVQALNERDARGGTRYVELLRSHFGVIAPDFRLQRPEYIGGGQSPLMITAIAQTAPTEDEPLGALGAAGTAHGQHRASYAATEHGYILGIINVRSELSYQQGLHRMWSRQTRYDFYWPSLAGLGEQAIMLKEIYCTGNPANDDTVFGYQERWHEYRTRTSEVTGIMRSTASGTIDGWHLAQKFASAPGLNTAFIEDNPDMARVLAAGSLASGQQYLADIMINRTAVRPIPTYGTPVTLGRF